MRFAADAALVLALCAIVFVTLRPFDADNDLELVPFADLAGGIVHRDAGSLREAVVGAVGNVLLFVPLGAALALRGASLRLGAGVALLVSGSVELAQLVVPGRTTAVDDVVLNVAGAAVGLALTKAWLRRSRVSGARSMQPRPARRP